jgi:hypothetical protein
MKMIPITVVVLSGASGACRLIGFAAGTMLSGIATGYFWSHASHVTLHADPDGGVLSYAAPF